MWNPFKSSRRAAEDIPQGISGKPFRAGRVVYNTDRNLARLSRLRAEVQVMDEELSGSPNETRKAQLEKRLKSFKAEIILREASQTLRGED